ncbi:hypothetical protein IJM86_00815 [bacterium]|nr:hypothetical protein [bacterium]
MKKCFISFLLLFSVLTCFSQISTNIVTAARIESGIASSDGIIDAPDDEISTEAHYRSTYKVAGFEVIRVMLNLIEEEEWVKYHMIAEDGITLLFLNPQKDFDAESLLEALNNWEHVGNEGIVVFSNPDSSTKIDVYQFSKANKWLLTKQDDGVVCYTIGDAKME